MPSSDWEASARHKPLLSTPIATVPSTAPSSGSGPRPKSHSRQALSRLQSYSIYRKRMQPTPPIQHRQSSTGWNTRGSGCSSSIMPMHPNCSKPTTRAHPEDTSCLPQERSFSTRWVLPGHLHSRRWIQKKRWTFSSNEQNVHRST